jgi:hypothetical protein
MDGGRAGDNPGELEDVLWTAADIGAAGNHQNIPSRKMLLRVSGEKWPLG